MEADAGHIDRAVKSGLETHGVFEYGKFRLD